MSLAKPFGNELLYNG